MASTLVWTIILWHSSRFTEINCRENQNFSLCLSEVKNYYVQLFDELGVYASSIPKIVIKIWKCWVILQQLPMKWDNPFYRSAGINCITWSNVFSMFEQCCIRDEKNCCVQLFVWDQYVLVSFPRDHLFSLVPIKANQTDVWQMFSFMFDITFETWI